MTQPTNSTSTSTPTATSGITLDAKTLGGLAQVSGSASQPAPLEATTASPKIRVGEFSEIYSSQPFISSYAFSQALRETKMPSVHPAYYGGLNDPYDTQRHVVARVFPFTVNPNDSFDRQLITKLANANITYPYMRNPDGSVIVRNGRTCLDLKNESVKTVVRDHFMSVLENYQGLHLAGFDNYEAAMAESSLPTDQKKRAIEAGRDMMQNLCNGVLPSSGKVSMVGDLTYMDKSRAGYTSITGETTLAFVQRKEFTKNVILRIDTQGQGYYDASPLYDSRVAKPSINYHVVLTNVAPATVERAKQLTEFTRGALGSTLDTGAGIVNIAFARDTDLLNKDDVILGRDAAKAMKPLSVDVGLWAKYLGDVNSSVVPTLKQFPALPVVDDTKYKQYGLLFQSTAPRTNPFLIDVTDPHNDVTVRRLRELQGQTKDAVIAHANGAEYLHQGKYLLPNFKNADVRTLMQDYAIASSSAYGKVIEGLSDYEQAVTELGTDIYGGSVTITPANGPVEYKPNKLITPAGNHAVADARAFFRTTATASPYGAIIYSGNISYNTALADQKLAEFVTGVTRNVVVDVTADMTVEQLREAFSKYAKVQPGMRLNVNMTGVAAINAASVADARSKVEAALKDPQGSTTFLGANLYLATDKNLSAADLIANLQNKTPQARIGLAVEDVPEAAASSAVSSFLTVPGIKKDATLRK